uniref:Uncharacterized protein n=1 Tax=Glossina pallidipes TaxID=7398 RepID=A0A1A9ZFE7_GLOPL
MWDYEDDSNNNDNNDDDNDDDDDDEDDDNNNDDDAYLQSSRYPLRAGNYYLLRLMTFGLSMPSIVFCRLSSMELWILGAICSIADLLPIVSYRLLLPYNYYFPLSTIPDSHLCSAAYCLLPIIVYCLHFLLLMADKSLLPIIIYNLIQLSSIAYYRPLPITAHCLLLSLADYRLQAF